MKCEWGHAYNLFEQLAKVRLSCSQEARRYVPARPALWGRTSQTGLSAVKENADQSPGCEADEGCESASVHQVREHFTPEDNDADGAFSRVLGFR